VFRYLDSAFNMQMSRIIDHILDFECEKEDRKMKILEKTLKQNKLVREESAFEEDTSGNIKRKQPLGEETKKIFGVEPNLLFPDNLNPQKLLRAYEDFKKYMFANL